MKYAFVAAVAIVSGLVSPNVASAQSNDVILKRLEVLERENAALRDRVRRIEGAKLGATSAPISAGTSPSTKYGAGGAALAADMPIKGAPYAPALAYNWTGWYVGLNAGWAAGNTAISDPGFDWFGATFDRDKTSFTAGGQIGYKYQFGRAVVGMEADLNWLKLGKDTNYDCAGSVSCDVLITSKWNWLATVRGLAGVAIDNGLVYLTAGAAIAKPKLSWIEFGDPPDTWPEFGSTRVGWTFGAGIEYALVSNWTAKLEGLYVDLGRFSSVNGRGFVLEVHNTAFIGRVGVNYKFDWGKGPIAGKGPVVTRY